MSNIEQEIFDYNKIYLDRNISCPHKTSTPAILYINVLLVVTD